MSIYAIVVIILVGLIAYFHWLQGLFSATLSALFAILASVTALGYHETMVNMLLGGKMADQADAMVVAAMFAGIYLLLRVVFDKFVPGYVGFPSTVDKAGGAAMGVVAGVFSVGTLTIAAQMLPFGPTVAGYSRYELAPDREISIKLMGVTQLKAATVSGELRNATLEEGRTGLLLPVDDWALGLAEHVSAGSLAGDRSIDSVHPDWLTELAANRMALQPGARIVARNTGSHQDIAVAGLYVIGGTVGQQWAQPAAVRTEKLPATLATTASQSLLVVRMKVDVQATGESDIFRFSPGGVRVVVDGKEIFAIGTLSDGTALLRSRADDPLFVEVKGGDAFANMVFLVDNGEVLEKNAGGGMKVRAGAFLAVKRRALVDLSGMEVASGRPPADQVMIKGEQQRAAASPSQAVPMPGQAPGGGSGVLSNIVIAVGNRLPSAINVGTPDASVSGGRLKGGTFSLTDRRFSRLQLDGVESVEMMRSGEYTVDELYAPANHTVVMVSAIAPPEASADKWAWADTLGQFALGTDDGRTIAPNGAVAVVRAGASRRMVVAYNADGAAPGISRVEGGIPTDVSLLFVAPAQSRVTRLMYRGQAIQTAQLLVP